jgi:mRNA interferase RelE/StbE
MNYELVFKDEALKEWKKLDSNLREVFKNKLAERLKEPHIPSSLLRGMSDCYKIKLRGAGYRLVYQVRDKEVVVVVIAVGKRDRNLVYKMAKGRL